jgi:uncharacterized protein YecT (DUF1311 family)
MIRPSGISLVLACLFVVPIASAQENVDCGYPLNNSERTYCAEKALKDAETDMDAAYDRLQTVLAEMEKALPDHLKGSPAALADAQDAWRIYRDKDCKAYGFPFQGGTRGNELYQGCMIILTMQRTEDFNATVDDYGN